MPKYDRTNEVMKSAIDEIMELRRVNNIMSAQLNMFDKCFALFMARPPEEEPMPMKPDVVSQLNMAIIRNIEDDAAKTNADAMDGKQ